MKKKFDDFDPPSFRISEEQAAKAAEELPAEVVEELDFAIEQVTAFARARRDSMVEFEKETGSINPGILYTMHKMEVDEPASLQLAKYAETQGAYEGLDAHRFAAAIRLSNLKK